MNDHNIPVFLDCNYEVLQNARNKLDELSGSSIKWVDISNLINCITDELKSRYNGGEIGSVNILIDEMIKRLSKGITYSIDRAMSYDSASREMLRGYVERALNYTKPIDRSKYHNLSDEEIEYIYGQILTDGWYFLKSLSDFDGEKGKEALKLFLSNYVGDINYSDIENVFKSMNSEEREEIYGMLDGSYICLSTKDSANPFFNINSDELKYYVETFLDNPIYDETTSFIIYSVMVGRGLGHYGNSSVTLKFGDFEIEKEWGDIWDDLKGYGGGNSFDYLSFFKDNIDNCNSSGGNVVFNLNGLDCNISFEKLKEAVFSTSITNNESNGEKRISLSFGGEYWGDPKKDYYSTESNTLNFLKSLVDADAFSSADLDKKNQLSIFGKKVNISLNEMSRCYNENNEFDVAKLLTNVELPESAIIHYNNYLGNDLNLDDYSIVSSNKAYSFFGKYGAVKQSEIKQIAAYPEYHPWEYNKLMEFGKKEYGLTEDEVYILMNSIDRYADVGACSYADACNLIYELYDFDEEKFEKDFGYPMVDREKVNGNQLLFDFFINTNTGTDSDSLILKNSDGSLSLNNDYLCGDYMNIETQKYMMFSDNDVSGFKYMDDFLKANNSSLLDDYKTTSIGVGDKTDVSYSSDAYGRLKEAIDNGDAVSMHILNYNMYKVNSNSSLGYNSGSHAITPVGLTEEGVLAESWGELYYVPFDDVFTYTIFEKNN